MPRAVLCDSVETAARWVDQNGPAFIKRNHSTGGTGLRAIARPTDAARAWNGIGSPQTLLIQNRIAGPVGVTEMVVHRGIATAWFSSLKVRTNGPLGGSLIRRMVNPPDMAGLVKKLAAETGFCGLCRFDWVQGSVTGKVSILEFHPRPPSGYACGRCAGIDVLVALGALLRDDQTSTQKPLPEASLFDAPVCCYFPERLRYPLRRNWGDLKYWLPRTNVVSWRNIPFDDPAVLGSIINREVASIPRYEVREMRKLIADGIERFREKFFRTLH